MKVGLGAGPVGAHVEIEVDVGLQDALLELGELGAGVDAEFVGEQAAGVGVDGEGFGLAAAAVEGEHQQLAQALAQRVGGGQGGEFGDGLGVAADFEVEVEAGLQQGQPPLVQAGALGVGVGAGEPGQRLAVPEAECLVHQLAGAAAVARAACLVGLCREPFGGVDVEAALPDAYGVAAGFADEGVGVGSEGLAQAGGVGAQRGERRVRRFIAPEGVDELGGAVAVRPPRSSRAASSARCWGDPVWSSSSPRQARTGPSTVKRSRCPCPVSPAIVTPLPVLLGRTGQSALLKPSASAGVRPLHKDFPGPRA
ncbi:hypothetical protein GCM10020000_46570 [Streptomyces olivoverticillatus]